MPKQPATAAAFERMPVVSIDRDALVRNWRTLDAAQPGARTGAAIKADGYGLGAARVAVTLFEAGCRDFFVAWVSEGVEVRDALDRHRRSGGPEAPRIFVLQGLEPAAVSELLARRLTPVLSTGEDVAVWREGLAAHGASAPAALQVESGMNRLGVERREAEKLAVDFAAGTLDLSLLLSHLASADEPAGLDGLGGQSGEQHAEFRAIARHFPTLPKSLANSAATLLSPHYGFDLTRPGIALYGGAAGPQSHGRLAPVATLMGSVLQVREAPKGARVGYGGTTVLNRPTRLATVGLGYGDGYPRAASGSGVPMRAVECGAHAFIADHRVPLIGRISMDLTLLDVSEVPEDSIRAGQRAEFFGPNISIDAAAKAAGTIAYELLTGLGARVRRDWAGA